MPLTSCSVRFTCFPGRHLKSSNEKSEYLPSNFEKFVNDVINVDVFGLVFHSFLIAEPFKNYYNKYDIYNYILI
jgi:hypothetical protein